MSPDNGVINHHVPVVRVIQQNLEDLLPDSGPGLAGETLVGTLPVAVPSGQVLPLSAAAQQPQQAIHEGLVVLGRIADPTRTPRQKSLYPAPLSGTQLVTHHAPPFIPLYCQGYTRRPCVLFLLCCLNHVSSNCRFALRTCLKSPLSPSVRR